MDNFIFTVGFEGRICKWDSRKLQQPIIIQDLYCVNEQQNLTQLEAMPLGFDISPGNNDLIYVNTIEGCVYEMLLTPNSLQQRSFFPDLHDAPITKIRTVDFKTYFKKLIESKGYTDIKANPKFVNFYLTASFDWTIKLWKQNMTDSVTFEFHNDFVSSLAVNPQSPFCFASGDTEGKVAVWKLATGTS